MVYPLALRRCLPYFGELIIRSMDWAGRILHGATGFSLYIIFRLHSADTALMAIERRTLNRAGYHLPYRFHTTPQYNIHIAFSLWTDLDEALPQNIAAYKTMGNDSLSPPPPCTTFLDVWAKAPSGSCLSYRYS